MRAGVMLILPGLALILLAAHLMHAGWLPLAVVALLLIGLPWQWPALVATIVLIGIRLRFAHRMLLLTGRLPAPPPVPEG